MDRGRPIWDAFNLRLAWRPEFRSPIRSKNCWRFPRNRVIDSKLRNQDLQQQQIAVGELTALAIAIQLSATRLGSEAVFNKLNATSSDKTLLAATVTGGPAAGTYQFTPVRMAQNHQLISGGVASLDDAIGGGALSLRLGGFTDRGLDLELLNGGAGVERGKIRVTDRSGTSEVIDLRFALTVDDVLDRFNRAEEINVQAVADGDSIRLLDQTGLTTTNLKVQEIGGGKTAADLGLGGIDVAASDVTGQDLVRLFEQMSVRQLNDAAGLSIRDELPDLEITFGDGSAPLEINLQRDEIRTLGDLLDALNAADPARLQAELSSDGERLVLTDLTSGSGGTFAVSSALGGTLAEDLGLTGSAAGGVIAGRRLLGGLQGPLLHSLSGGSGFGALGDLNLTDRSGALTSVNLSSAETLADVMDLINAAGVGIVASVNAARSGIVLRDTTGLNASNLIVANGDATNTADKLGLAIDAAQSSVDSGSLDLQTIHENTLLESLNNGDGVQLSSFIITDSTGKESGVNLKISDAKTIGDVLDLINGLDLAVEARINDTGDGIALIDTGGGGGQLSVAESGSASTAADLGILGTAKVVDINGTPTQVIDGAMTAIINFDASDTLEDVVVKINELDLGVTASIFNAGSGSTPYRISLVSNSDGTAGEMLLDTSQFGLAFSEIVSAQDAILQVGSSAVPGAGILATSSSNQFTSVIDGVTLSMGGVSSGPVTINIQSTDSDLVSNAKLFVDQYNKLRDKIDELTFYDADAGVTGILFGSNETLQIESRLSRLVTDRFFGVGPFQSLEQLGISVDEEGQLALDETKLKEAFARDAEGVEQFFTTEVQGFGEKFNAAIETIAGLGDSLLLTRTEILQRKIDANADKIDFYNQRLERERERLLKYYYNMEIAISKIQANMSVVQSLAPMPLIIGGSSSQSSA